MQPERTINVGIVGLGFMAATHLKAYRQIPAARIHSVCNSSGRNLDGDLTKVGGNINVNDPVRLDMSQVKGTREFQNLLNDPEIDLIDICTPTLQHPDMLTAALRAGKHVICEKPLARGSTLARTMVEAARGAKTFAMPAMCLRFWPEWSWLKETIEKNTYGRVLSARFRRVAEPPTWGQKHFPEGTKSGGAILDLHIHDIDFIQFCFGMPRRVFASGYVKYTGAIDHVVAQFEVGSGAIVHAEGGWAMAPGFGFSMAYTVNFEHATVDYDLVRAPDNLLRLFRPGHPPETVKCLGPDGYVGELQHIFQSILTGKAPSIVTMEDGLRAIQICEAEEKSIDSGAVVEIGG
jgi:predicted dehydrogenase